MTVEKMNVAECNSLNSEKYCHKSIGIRNTFYQSIVIGIDNSFHVNIHNDQPSTLCVVSEMLAICL